MSIGISAGHVDVSDGCYFFFFCSCCEYSPSDSEDDGSGFEVRIGSLGGTELFMLVVFFLFASTAALAILKGLLSESGIPAFLRTFSIQLGGRV